MTLEVLQSKSQIDSARTELKKRGLCHIRSPWQKTLTRLRLNKKLSIGDERKSWDVLRSIQLIEDRLPVSASILDIGCFCSEILPSLNNLGYHNMTGVDLNPNIALMPYADKISYLQENFLNTSLESGTFDAITSISVIEHGFDPKALLNEVSRLLKPGGLFIASFDYWPDKIDTGDKTFFDMSWLIFSKGEVNELFEQARQWDMKSLGDIHSEADERTISCDGFDYTFGWLVLEKNAQS